MSETFYILFSKLEFDVDKMSEKDEKERDTKEEETDNDESKPSDDKATEALDASPETDTNDNKIPEVTQNHVTDDTAATIGHDEIHVDITRKAKESDDNVIDDVDGSGNKDAHVITTQPTVVYGYDQGAYIQDNGSRIVTQGPKKPKPKDFVVTSCFVVLCCNFIFGLLGYHFGGEYFS